MSRYRGGGDYGRNRSGRRFTDALDSLTGSSGGSSLSGAARAAMWRAGLNFASNAASSTYNRWLYGGSRRTASGRRPRAYNRGRSGAARIRYGRMGWPSAARARRRLPRRRGIPRIRRVGGDTRYRGAVSGGLRSHLQPLAPLPQTLPVGAAGYKYSIDYAGQAVTSLAPVIFPVGLVGQGTAVSQRVATDIVYKEIELSMFFDTVSAGGDSIQIDIFYDLTPTGAVPPASDLYVEDPAGVYSSRGMLNLDNTARFIRLHSQRVEIGSYSASGVPLTKRVMYKVVPLNNLVCSYAATDTAGQIANVKTGLLFVVVRCGDGGAGSTTMDFSHRIHFQDA